MDQGGEDQPEHRRSTDGAQTDTDRRTDGRVVILEKPFLTAALFDTDTHC